MRIDVWLNKVCLLKSRSQAKNGCRAGRILLAGESVRESQELRPGDLLTLQLPEREIQIRVLVIPTGNVAKRDAERFYELIAEGPPPDAS